MKKLSELLKELEYIYGNYGDLDLSLQDENLSWEDDVYAVPEEYDGEFVLNIRSWPY